MAKTLKKNSVRPQSSPIESTRHTLTTAEGKNTFSIGLFTQHFYYSDDKQGVEITVTIDYGDEITAKKFWLPL